MSALTGHKDPGSESSSLSLSLSWSFRIENTRIVHVPVVGLGSWPLVTGYWLLVTDCRLVTLLLPQSDCTFREITANSHY